MWQVLRSRDNLPGWPPGRALEYLVLRAFQLEGAEVTWPYEVRRKGVLLEQVDGAVYCDGTTCLIEAKAHSEPIDFMAISRMKARLLRRPRTVIGAVFSVGEFTEAAYQLTECLPPPDVLLWDGDDLGWALQRQAMREGMRKKLRHAIEQGFADLELTRQGERS
jgi:Restriction endonuclease